MAKRALITGITGQDGSYLAELLLSHGYEVHGIIRRASTFNTGRLDHIYSDPHNSGARLKLHHGDPAPGDLQFGCAKPRESELRLPGIHYRHHGHRRRALA